MTKKYYYKKIDEFFLGKEKMETREDKNMVKFEFFFQIYLFWTYIRKTNTFIFFGACITLSSNARIWANLPIHSFLFGRPNPCLQGTSV